jgi:Uma2 family endonuclease
MTEAGKKLLYLAKADLDRIAAHRMSQPLPRPWTVEDFLAWERRQTERYEFVGGVVRMMVGGANAHTIIKGNVFVALHARRRGGQYRALGAGPKVVTATATMYPDAIVVCGPLDLAEAQVRAPTVVVEVLSRSTEDHDRGAKWVAYRDLESLQHYLLIGQDERRVEVYSREARRWSLQVIEPPETVALPAIGAALTFDEIYEGSGR